MLFFQPFSEKFEEFGLGDFGKSIVNVIVKIFEALRNDRKSNIALTLLDLQLIFPGKNRLLVLKTENKDTEVIRHDDYIKLSSLEKTDYFSILYRKFYTEVLRIFGNKFSSGNCPARKIIEKEFFLEFGEEKTTKSINTKSDTCEISEIIFASKICTHEVTMSLGQTLKVI